MADAKPLSENSYSRSLSFWLVPAFTLLALIIGWVLMVSIENRSQKQVNKGIQASIPSGWSIDTGFPSEKMVFSAKEPLSKHHCYVVSLLSPTMEGSLADAAFKRNLERAQKLNSYKVLEQVEVILFNQEAYKLHFAYVKPNESSQLPTVVEGVEYFIKSGENILLITLEEDSRYFDQALPGFMDFVASTSAATGDNQ